MENKKKISKTDCMRRKISHRLKYVFGKRAKAEEEYKGYIIEGQELSFNKCESLYYDEKSEVLVIYDMIKEQFILCSGDMAVFKQVLYADYGTICLGNKNEMFRYISKYLADKGISNTDEKQAYNALRSRYYRVPMGLLGILARCYIAVS